MINAMEYTSSSLNLYLSSHSIKLAKCSGQGKWEEIHGFTNLEKTFPVILFGH